MGSTTWILQYTDANKCIAIAPSIVILLSILGGESVGKSVGESAHTSSLICLISLQNWNINWVSPRDNPKQGPVDPVVVGSPPGVWNSTLSKPAAFLSPTAPCSTHTYGSSALLQSVGGKQEKKHLGKRRKRGTGRMSRPRAFAIPWHHCSSGERRRGWSWRHVVITLVTAPCNWCHLCLLNLDERHSCATFAPPVTNREGSSSATQHCLGSAVL